MASKGRPNKISVLDVVYPEPKTMNVKKYIDVHSGGLIEIGNICRELLSGKASFSRRKSHAYVIKNTKYNYEQILDIECGFDIETTKIEVKNNNGDVIGYRSYMYIWQMTLSDYIITGRTWNEWHMVMSMIQDFLQLYTIHETLVEVDKAGNVQIDDNGKPLTYVKTYKRQILMWIANNSFEFQFISSHFVNGMNIIEDCFSDKLRKPIKFGLNFSGIPADKPRSERNPYRAQGAGFVVQDILRVTGGDLETAAKSYCGTLKAVGDLDYELIRNSQTVLNDEKEMKYVYNDVKILHEWSSFYNAVYLKQAQFMPMTSTAIIREAVRHNFQKVDNDKSNRGCLSAWILNQMPRNIEEYFNVVMLLYRGGYTHANVMYVGKYCRKVHGMDFTSSYPAVMLQCDFPSTEFELYEDVITEDDVNAFCSRWCRSDQRHKKVWYADFTFYDVRPKTSHSVENINRVKEYINLGNDKFAYRRMFNAVLDNGKILSTDQMSVCLTEQDWYTYQEFYEWEVCEVSNFRASDASPLPKYLTDVIIEMYRRKTVLKRHGKDDTVEYQIAKAFVNGLYGLCVQKMHFDESWFEYSDQMIHWSTRHKKFDGNGNSDGYIDGRLNYSDLDANWNAEYHSKNGNEKKAKIILSPYWGVWVTAYARRRILKAIHALGTDCLYSDTDSVYFVNYEKHKKYFDDWNAEIDKLNRSLFGDLYDVMKELGTFDEIVIKGTDDKDNNVKSTEYTFCTLGAKRYIKYDQYDNLEITIAGLPKHSLIHAAHEEVYQEVINDFMESGYEYDDIEFEHIEIRKDEIRCKVCEMFTRSMEIIKDYAEKNTHAFCDVPHSDIVTDYQGHTEEMHETSSISIYGVSFKMSVESYWYRLALYIQKEGLRIEDYKVYRQQCESWNQV